MRTLTRVSRGYDDTEAGRLKAVQDVNAILAANPDATVKYRVEGASKLGQDEADEQAAREAVVRAAIETTVRAEVTPGIEADVRTTMTKTIEAETVEKLVTGELKDPRLQVVAGQVEP